MAPIDAIHRALHTDNAELLRETLRQHPELKAHINAPVGSFDSPLVLSARSPGMLDAMIEAGADINARSRWWAGGFGLLDLCPEDLAPYAIQRGAHLDVHSAARLGYLDELRQLVSANRELVHARGGDGKTPLHFARTAQIAGFLLSNGADINARDIDHESTPAQHLIGERIEVATFLVERGCEADIFLAAALGDTKLARRLVDENPECLRQRVNEEHFPMQNPRAGGTIYQWTLGFNVSPHEVALKFKHPETLQFLIDRSPPEVRFFVYAWLGDEAKARALAPEFGALVQHLKPAELRQAADAARNNNTAACKLLIEGGLPIDSRGQHHGMPLHWATWHGNTELTRFLVQRGAPLEDADNEFHCSPLAWAIHGSENGWHRKQGDYPGVVRVLLAAGARVPNRAAGTPEVRALLAEPKKG